MVPISVNWGRKWDCGNYENAEVRNIGFDKVNSNYQSNEISPDLNINGPSRLLTTPVFVNYAYALEAGEYALSYFNIKVAKSVSDISYFTAERSQLIKNSKPVGQTFNVGKGETAYIGNFWIACSNPSLLWRYYTPAGNSFKNHLVWGLAPDAPMTDLLRRIV